MENLSAILQKERSREQRNDWKVIHFFKYNDRDKDYWRAYEQSSWLMTAICHVKMTVSHKANAQVEGGSYTYVGFPLSSIEKYMPPNAIVQDRKDDTMTIALPEDTFPDDVEIATLKDDFSRWKSEQPMKEKAKKAARKDDQQSDAHDVPFADSPSATAPAPATTLRGLARELLSANDDVKSVSVSITIERK